MSACAIESALRLLIPCEWGINGPTGRVCKTCNGKAYIGSDNDECEHIWHVPQGVLWKDCRCELCGEQLLQEYRK
jgi:hypothetical protein